MEISAWDGKNPFFCRESLEQSLKTLRDHPGDPLAPERPFLCLEFDLAFRNEAGMSDVPFVKWLEDGSALHLHDPLWQMQAVKLVKLASGQSAASALQAMWTLCRNDVSLKQGDWFDCASALHGIPAELRSLMEAALESAHSQARPLAVMMSSEHSVQFLVQEAWEARLGQTENLRVHCSPVFRRPFSTVLSTGEAHLFLPARNPKDKLDLRASAEVIHEIAHVEHLLGALKQGRLLREISTFEKEVYAYRAECDFLQKSTLGKPPLSMRRILQGFVYDWSSFQALSLETDRALFSGQDDPSFLTQQGTQTSLVQPFLSAVYLAAAACFPLPLET